MIHTNKIIKMDLPGNGSIYINCKGDIEPCHFPDCQEVANVAVPYPGGDDNFVLPLCIGHDNERIKDEVS